MGMFIKLRVLFGFRKNLLLAWRLLRDGRVPLSSKLLVPGAIMYGFLPIDLMPDFFPALGQADDLTMLLIAVMVFLRICPQSLVREHQAAMEGRGRTAKRAEVDPSRVVEGDYRVLD